MKQALQVTQFGSIVNTLTLYLNTYLHAVNPIQLGIALIAMHILIMVGFLAPQISRRVNAQSINDNWAVRSEKEPLLKHGVFRAGPKLSQKPRHAFLAPRCIKMNYQAILRSTLGSKAGQKRRKSNESKYGVKRLRTDYVLEILIA
ncbi:hypothetical protein MMC21_001198 [Puttea exsequens]|nr:hypothetical protein [Puttea exsequens]